MKNLVLKTEERTQFPWKVTVLYPGDLKDSSRSKSVRSLRFEDTYLKSSGINLPHIIIMIDVTRREIKVMKHSCSFEAMIDIIQECFPKDLTYKDFKFH